VSRRRSKSVLGKTRKENADDMPLMITMIGDPEIVRLKWLGVLPADAMASEREALIGDNVHCLAAPDESTADFHRRLRAIVIAKGKPYSAILLGCPENGKPPMAGLPPPPAPPSSSPVLSLDAAPEGSTLN
jgi:hypothetical protein